MPDGKRLNECFADLQNALMGTLPALGDGWAWRIGDRHAYHQAKVLTRQPLATVIGSGIIHREAMGLIAEHAIREELRSGRLALWVMFDNVPEKMDHHGSYLIDHDAVRFGWINPSKEPPSSLRDRPLWILLSDWLAFKQRFMSFREGIEWSEAVIHVAPLPPKDAVQPFTNDGRLQWIREQPRMAADAAFKLYRKDPRYDGTKQAAFRADWRNERKTTRGRPRK